MLLRTIAYSIFEYKTNLNKLGGIVVFIMGVLGLLLPNVVYYISLILLGIGMIVGMLGSSRAVKKYLKI